MSLREDMDTLERYIARGDGDAYLRGEAKKLPPEGLPSDDTAGKKFPTTYAFIAARGD